MSCMYLPFRYLDTACSATRKEKDFIDLESPNVKNLLNQVQYTTLPKPTIMHSS